LDRITKDYLVSDFKEIFFSKFKKNPEIISAAPGRVNIIGEHTDYNFGLAMPIAIDKWIISMLSERSDRKVNIHSVNYSKTILSNLNDLENHSELWEKYVKSSINVINKKYNLNNGFDILIGGNIPIGFGMSSSAALEVSIVSCILGKYFDKNDKYEILEICNKVEKDMLGIESGMLDQYASIFSMDKNFLLIDFNNISHEYFDSNMKESSWLLINSMISRELVDSEYNIRVAECREGLNLLNKLTGKKLSLSSLLLKDIEFIKNNRKLYNRLFHICSENQRVNKMREEILSGNLVNIGKLLLESHYSLSTKYEVSCDEIDFIISISKEHSGFFGGRIMGGGFGGCTINLVKKKLKKEFMCFVKDKFYKKYKSNIEIEEVVFSEGSHLLRN
tara:strand:+ start:8839 stop:10011 length:1173 start_codon:yes stop_codon:yes gene_type:complete